MRIVCSALPISPGWHLRHVRVEESTSNSEIYFNCDCWLSVDTEGEEVIKEFPIVNNQQEPLPVIEYIVSVHIGDHWGAETTANVYVTVYGDRGDSGARKLRHSLPPGERFARSKIDYFLLEAVSLGQIKKVVLGHDGEGYGAGMYLKMVTIKESQDSGTEWIFPFWNWLDNYLGLCQTVCKLYTIGRRLSTNPNPIAQSGGLWIIDITGSEYDRSEILANFDIVFYGDKGKEEVEAKIVGNIIQMKEELKNVGSLYKIRVSWSDIKLKKAWHLTSIHMKHSVTNQEMWLMADCWLKPNDENCIEIPAMYPNKDPLPVVEYAIHLHTRDMKNTGINGTVYICIEGENGDTGNRLLNISGSHRKDSKEQVDVFKIKAVHLGKLQRIVVTFCNPQKDQWFLEKIIVKDLEFSFTNYTFIHNDWIICDNEKGLTESIIMLKELTVEPYTIKHFNASTKGKWIMQVLGTQPEGENVDISFVVFGRTGKSSLLKLKNLDYSPFLVDVGNIGSIIKVSFLSMDLTYETKLQLQKVRMKDVDTKQEIGFYPGKPLLPNEDSAESVQELPAVLPNIPPLSEVSYFLQIRTGNFPASGTDADVFITVFGENGDTCKRKLRHLPLSGMFEKDKVNIFTIKAVDLGTLSKVQVEHSAVGYGAGWYLDQITIQETDKTDTEYLFPCHQWLDTGIGDTQTKCELKLLGKVSKNVGRLRTSPQGAVDVIVMVGEVENGFVSSAVSVTICCEHGNHELAVFAKGSLKQNSTSQTTVDLKKDLGPVRKLRLQMQDDAKGNNWFCKEVKLQHKQSNEILEFPFLQTFSNDGRNTVAELPALYPDRRALIVKTYAVYVTTAQSPQIITDAKVFITLRGSMGDTGRRTFSYKRTDFTNKRKTAEFQLECVDIGVIQELFIEKEQQTNLQLEKVVVEDGKYIKKKYVFMPQQWKKDKNKMMSMTLQVTETQEGNSTEALVYGKKPLTSDGEWIIYLTMSNEEIQQPITSPPEDACDLVFVLYGDKGKSSFIVGEKGTLSRVKTLMTYKVNLMNDLGELYKVRLGFEKLNENRDRLYFHHLKMQNTKTLDMFNYSINRNLPLSMNGDRWIEVPVEWPLKSTLTAVKYYVTVFAAGNLNQGAGVDLSLCLHGKQGDSGDRHLTWQNAEDENGEELFTSVLNAVEIGEIFHIDISMSSKNDCQLHIKKIQIQESSKQEVYIFELNQDFSVIANEPAIWRKVPLSEVAHEEQESNHIRLLNFDRKEIVKDELVEHLIKVYTGDVTSAGTDAHVHIHLFGEWDSFGPVELTQPLEDHNPFERGMVDTFRILSKNLGRILHIEVGHDGKGLGSGWFLDKIEITNVTTNETTLFRCSRWLSEEEDDGSTVIHLYS
ncbi:lipoxygenase homology domain-containing protein 1-like [Spea bombifrons]|uniref:lipoxygenase homology domain-containing protein 1-like n=1 Tax=Spea bombifrons TaxID=233779 RepID=UPI00234A43BD|nr:lipoxygenase homology domain-containing protein 1-like [Spea bombifrons]